MCGCYWATLWIMKWEKNSLHQVPKNFNLYLIIRRLFGDRVGNGVHHQGMDSVHILAATIAIVLCQRTLSFKLRLQLPSMSLFLSRLKMGSMQSYHALYR